MEECIFCKIINKEIPTNIIEEDEDVIVIKDISPKAPTHLLIIPKKHIRTLNDLEDFDLAGKLLVMAQKLSKKFGESYRIAV